MTQHHHATRRDARAVQRAPRRRVVASLVSATLTLAAVAGCTDDRAFSPPPAPPVVPAAGTVGLRAAADCDELADAAHAVLTRAVDRAWATAADGMAEEQADSGAGVAAPAAPATTAATPAPERRSSGPERAIVGTNNQERDVDEADLVKTDGELLVTLVAGVLSVVVLDAEPAVDATLELQGRPADQMFLRGDRALLIGSAHGGASPLRESGEIGVAPTTTPAVPTTPGPTTEVPPTTAPPTTAPPTTAPPTPVPPTTVPPTTVPPRALPPFDEATTLTVVSLEDPSAPAVLDSVDVEGTVVAAREIDGTASVVLRSSPSVLPQVSSATGPDQERAELAAVDGTDLLPRRSSDGVVRPLGGCEDVSVDPAVVDGARDEPDEVDPSGIDPAPPVDELSTVTVLTVGDDLADLAPVSVQGDVQTVYASTDAVYTTSTVWAEGASATSVHRFGLNGDGPATYQGSGRVPGALLDQFSLSEHDGALRAVTLMDDGELQARVTTLDTEGDTLDELGHVDGMGMGEQVQSVRFLGELVYLVTFRQVDPLYAVDLSDPAEPTVLGELKIPGFSEYLHPVGEGLLVGVGREVDPDTGIDEGLKVSLFDVSDPGRMAEVDQIVLPTSWSAVSQDHKAFTWDPARRQAVLPVTWQCGPADACTVADGGYSAILRIEGHDLRRVAELSHQVDGRPLEAMRSVVVDDDLWTVSTAAIGRSDADDPTAVELLGPR